MLPMPMLASIPAFAEKSFWWLLWTLLYLLRSTKTFIYYTFVTVVVLVFTCITVLCAEREVQIVYYVFFGPSLAFMFLYIFAAATLVFVEQQSRSESPKPGDMITRIWFLFPAEQQEFNGMRDYFISLYNDSEIFDSLNDREKSDLTRNILPSGRLLITKNGVKHMDLRDVKIAFRFLCYLVRNLLLNRKIGHMLVAFTKVLLATHCGIILMWTILAFQMQLYPTEGMFFVAVMCVMISLCLIMIGGNLCHVDLFNQGNIVFICTKLALFACTYYTFQRDCAAENTYTKAFFRATCQDNTTIHMYLVSGCDDTAYDAKRKIFVTGQHEVFITHVHQHPGFFQIGNITTTHMGKPDNEYQDDCDFSQLRSVRSSKVDACVQRWHSLPEMEIESHKVVCEIKDDLLDLLQRIKTVPTNTTDRNTVLEQVYSEVSLLLDRYLRYWPMFPPLAPVTFVFKHIWQWEAFHFVFKLVINVIFFGCATVERVIVMCFFVFECITRVYYFFTDLLSCLNTLRSLIPKLH
jgi:hypothetical protein